MTLRILQIPASDWLDWGTVAGTGRNGFIRALMQVETSPHLRGAHPCQFVSSRLNLGFSDVSKLGVTTSDEIC